MHSEYIVSFNEIEAAHWVCRLRSFNDSDVSVCVCVCVRGCKAYYGLMAFRGHKVSALFCVPSKEKHKFKQGLWNKNLQGYKILYRTSGKTEQPLLVECFYVYIFISLYVEASPPPKSLYYSVIIYRIFNIIRDTACLKKKNSACFFFCICLHYNI